MFLDKPIANTVADGREIVELCARAGVMLAVGSQRRRESHFRWIKAEIDGFEVSPGVWVCEGAEVDPDAVAVRDRFAAGVADAIRMLGLDETAA